MKKLLAVTVSTVVAVGGMGIATTTSARTLRHDDHVVKFNFEQSGPFIGMAGMATAFFLYAWSAIVLHDIVSLVVLPLVWLVLFVLACAWFTRHPYRVMLLPLIAIAVWFAAMLV